MHSALELLDHADSPADIGAHLDLAICRLVNYMEVEFSRQDNSPSGGTLPLQP